MDAEFCGQKRKLGSLLTLFFFLTTEFFKISTSITFVSRGNIKCRFGMCRVNYLVHIVSSAGLQPDENKIQAISNLPQPTNVKELLRFLGMSSYYRRFIPRFSHIASPLFRLTRLDVHFYWSKSCVSAFSELKQCLTSTPILVYPNFTMDFLICCDASNIAVGALLAQIHNNVEMPVAYASKQLNNAEQNYSTTEREALAVVWSIKHFHSYVYGRHFEIFTDHQPLVTWTKITNPSNRLNRLFLKIQEYDFTIKYRPGHCNFNADLLSRVVINSIKLNSNMNWIDTKISIHYCINLNH